MTYQFNKDLTESQRSALAIQIRRDGGNATIEFNREWNCDLLITSFDGGQVIFSALECMPAHAMNFPVVTKIN